jgi:hypothetical protein
MKAQSLSREDEQCLRLGREIVRLITDLRSVPAARGTDVAYALRDISFPGGRAYIFVTTDKEVAELFDYAASNRYEVKSATPRSQTN